MCWLCFVVCMFVFPWFQIVGISNCQIVIFPKLMISKKFDPEHKKQIFAEASGLRGSIRLVKVALTNTKSGQTDPCGPDTDQTCNKQQKKKLHKTGKPLAPISLKAGLLVFSATRFAQSRSHLDLIQSLWPLQICLATRNRSGASIGHGRYVPVTLP